jgi:cation diffusion facilitator CzcD-associated flavoprotein CzcO
MPTASPSRTSQPKIVVIGAGMSGICLAIRLKQRGFTNVTLYERSQRPGGTWNFNAYPGSACDVPSFLYSFSFAPNLNWSRRYAPQPEIFDYFQKCIRDFGIESQIVYGTGVEAARFDERTQRWQVALSDGSTAVCDVLVSAVGQLNLPSIPPIPGRERFAGPQFHAARWQADCDLRGKRVAIVGNAATTIQLLKPVAELAEKTYVFQRSPNYVMPKKDRAYSALSKAIFRYVPLVARLYRWWIFWKNEIRFLAFRKQSFISRYFSRRVNHQMARQFPKSSRLRSKVLPYYPAGCKRILLSDDYLETIQRSDVELVTESIESFDAVGVNAGGTHRPADVVIYATGFVSNPLLSALRIEGRGERRLDEEWNSRPLAYLGLMTPGFPNFFALYGPNTNLGHNSIIFMVECQVNYLLKCLERMRTHGSQTVEVREAAAVRYREELDSHLRETVWTTGCGNWYTNSAGVIVNNWCGPASSYWWRTRFLVADDLEFEPARPPTAAETTAVPQLATR